MKNYWKDRKFDKRGAMFLFVTCTTILTFVASMFTLIWTIHNHPQIVMGCGIAFVSIMFIGVCIEALFPKNDPNYYKTTPPDQVKHGRIYKALAWWFSWMDPLGHMEAEEK